MIREDCSDVMDGTESRKFTPQLPSDDINERMKLLVFKVQTDFCEHLQRLEGDREFIIKKWNVEGGAGITQYLDKGDVLEKVGVCASVVQGNLSLSAAHLLKESDDWPDPHQNTKFYTAGVTGVVYPKNPNVPTLNFSYRYFQMSSDDLGEIWWFGGGTDLIPYILHTDDCELFHGVLKRCCDKYDKSYYDRFKKDCDDHFFLEHRGERRGIGGIFFDELRDRNKNTCFNFVKTCMDNIVNSYEPIVLRRKGLGFSQHDRNWQLLRRGRLVEYNLMCDKATRYALKTPGVQYENILISLPPESTWRYNCAPEENSKECHLLEILRNPREWV